MGFDTSPKTQNRGPFFKNCTQNRSQYFICKIVGFFDRFNASFKNASIAKNVENDKTYLRLEIMKKMMSQYSTLNITEW